MTHRYLERHYQPLLSKFLNGDHMKINDRISDVTTSELHAEIKIWNNWSKAVQQLMYYNIFEPRSKLQVYLFGVYDETKKQEVFLNFTKANIEVYEFKQDKDDIILIEFETKNVIKVWKNDDNNDKYVSIEMFNTLQNMCNSMRKTIDQLKLQLNLKSEDTSNDEITIDNIYDMNECPRCGYTTENFNLLKKHILRKRLCSPIKQNYDMNYLKDILSPKSFDFQCFKCNRKFTTKHGLSLHDNVCNGEEPSMNIVSKIIEHEEKLNLLLEKS